MSCGTKVVRALLRFMWQRGHLQSVPYVPMENAPERNPEWYGEQERDRFLDGMFEMFPQWYTFFYITTRLGLRAGEVYAISRDRIRDVPPMLVVDRAVQRGHKDRPAALGPRKNNRVLTLSLTQDVVDAIRWHIKSGFSGFEFLFSEDGCFPKKVHSHARPMRLVQRALGLRELGHHRIGRHSVASQAATGGHSMRAIQAQLGHSSLKSTEQYAHLGKRAQLRIVADLEPASPPQRKGATRHGSPLLEVRWPCDEQARRLAVWMRIRRIHHDRLCLDFEHEARWWAYSASPALRDTFRRDAFPVGKPANTPRELLDSLEEL
ncbi:MAG: tyrosine-type recombinase/integrase [Deltaproteobacteria bacterium]|nr:tyrosine-type recombinase/integrase [Deltaproteobacteria bacterium]